MPIQQALIDAIDAAVGTGVPLSYSSASSANDVFEGYIWSLEIAAARSAGASIAYQDVTGNSATELIFRTSPGFIYSRAHPYTHAVVSFPGCPDVEAHIGVYVSGKSGIIHECDVAVIDQNEAALCRAQGVHPRNSKVLIAVECKFHTGTLQLGLARAFLGLTEELMKSGRYLVTNASSPTAQKMVNHHKVEWEFGLDLSDAAIAESLQARIKRAFRDYKIKHAKI